MHFNICVFILFVQYSCDKSYTIEVQYKEVYQLRISEGIPDSLLIWRNFDNFGCLAENKRNIDVIEKLRKCCYQFRQVGVSKNSPFYDVNYWEPRDWKSRW